MKLKIFTNIVWGELLLEKDKEFDVDDVVVDTYRIKVPMNHRGKFRYALIKDDEGALV